MNEFFRIYPLFIKARVIDDIDDSSIGDYMRSGSISLDDISSNIGSSIKQSLPDITIPEDSNDWEDPAIFKDKISPIFLATKLNAEPPFFSDKLDKRYLNEGFKYQKFD